MTLEEILQAQREIWGNKKMTPAEIAVALGVVYGDICRLVRQQQESGQLDSEELQKELGNIINSTVRWCDDFGFPPEDVIKTSQTAHQRYIDTR